MIIIASSPQFMHCSVKSIDLNIQMFVTFIYGFNTPSDRKSLWRDLRVMASSINLTWCLLGDFNEVKSVYEINGGDDTWDCGMQDFINCIEDLRAVGDFHTWWNSSDTKPSFKKLDRVMVNNHWLNLLPCSQAWFTTILLLSIMA